MSSRIERGLAAPDSGVRVITICEPDYRTRDFGRDDVARLVADYVAGRAAVVRLSEDGPEFLVETATSDGGRRTDVRGAEELAGIVRCRLEQPPAGIGGSTEDESEDVVKRGGIVARHRDGQVRPEIGGPHRVCYQPDPDAPPLCSTPGDIATDRYPVSNCLGCMDAIEDGFSRWLQEKGF